MSTLVSYASHNSLLCRAYDIRRTGITRLPLSAVSDLVQRTISSNLAVRLGLSQLFWALIVRVASSASAVATDLIMKQLQVKGAGIPSACECSTPQPMWRSADASML